MKKCGSHIGELDQKLKLTTAVHHNDRVVDEIHMTQSIRSIDAKIKVG